jgi:hypothetical protein
MKERETKDDAVQDDSVDGDVGDVETAGETTAAVAISGPEDTRPVGADTMVKVDDEKDSDESVDD